MHAFASRIVSLCAAVLGTACADGQPPREDAATSAAVASVAAESVAVARMSAHFAAPQGFSATTLEARAAWFTDSLRALLRADFGDGSSIGVLNWDPFTEAQDDAAGFTHTSTRWANDTALVEFAIRFDSTYAPGSATTVTLALTLEQAEWRIADFLSRGRSLATSIRSSSPTPTP